MYRINARTDFTPVFTHVRTPRSVPGRPEWDAEDVDLFIVEDGYSLQNEYNGMEGVLVVDAGVYFRDKLVAFVEVDGETHYKQYWYKKEHEAQQLRRKDQMKEFLYHVRYPHIPLFRVRLDQVSTLGFDRMSFALAAWISNRVDEKAIS